MSKALKDQILRFLSRATPVELFVDEYIDGWRRERDSEDLLKDDPQTSELLSSSFCVVDLYNPSNDRMEHEFDEQRLRLELANLVEEHGKT